jgi:hypothetical protein
MNLLIVCEANTQKSSVLSSWIVRVELLTILTALNSRLFRPLGPPVFEPWFEVRSQAADAWLAPGLVVAELKQLLFKPRLGIPHGIVGGERAVDSPLAGMSSPPSLSKGIWAEHHCDFFRAARQCEPAGRGGPRRYGDFAMPADTLDRKQKLFLHRRLYGRGSFIAFAARAFMAASESM